jgi:hypothetical protein
MNCTNGNDISWDEWFQSPKTKGIVGTVFVVYSVVFIVGLFVVRARYMTQMANVDAASRRDLEIAAHRRW